MLKANRQYIEALTSGLAEGSDIKFKEGDRWCVDISKKTLHYNQRELNNWPIETVKGLILHETGHLKYTTIDEEQSDIYKAHPEAMQLIHNVLEDARIEQELTDEYGDFAQEALEATAKSAFEEVELQDDEFIQYLTALAIQGESQRDKYYRFGEKTINTWNEIPNDIREDANKTRIFIDQARQAGSTEQIKKLADELYPHIKKYVDNYKPPKNLPSSSRMVGGGHGNSEILTSRSGLSAIPTDKELEGALYPYIHTLTQKLNDILKEKDSTRYTGAYQRGKLLSKNTYKVLADEKRIFSKRVNPNKPNYAIYLVLDESGSMAEYNRHKNCYIASYLVKRTCEKLGFKIRYLKYNHEITPIQALSEYRELPKGDNYDDLALEKIYETIDKKDDNIVFYFTDGGLCRNIQSVLAKLTKAGALTIGIGINTEQVRSHFPYHVVVPEVTQLPIAMIELLKRIIHR